MNYHLFNQLSDVIALLQEIQREGETMYLDQLPLSLKISGSGHEDNDRP